jgi:hypoxanthine phosphoribosyltransferase
MNESTDQHTSAVTLFGEKFVPFISAERIQERIVQIAGQLNADLAGKEPLFVCVLNGAFMFFADLLRHITIPCEVDFIRLSSYGAEKNSSGSVHLSMDVRQDCTKKNIVIIEDIVDSGLSVDFIKKLIEVKDPESVRIVTLLHKPDAAKIRHELDYVGFEIPSGFVIGYGLDYNQQGRHLPSVFVAEEKQR